MTDHRTSENDCPDCTGFERCDYHEGRRHERDRAETLLNDLETSTINVCPDCRSFVPSEHGPCSNCEKPVISHADRVEVVKKEAVRRRLQHDEGED